MTFKIERTSLSYDNYKNENKNVKPCKEAYKKGNYYFIDINSLEELLNFTVKYGEIIIYNETLEIYDDYRE